MSYDPYRVLEALKKRLRKPGFTHTQEVLSMVVDFESDPANSDEIDFKAKGAPLDTLIALCEAGPLDDGDVPSKQERDELVKHGYACRISVKGEQGYNAATYKGNIAYSHYFGADTMAEAKAKRIARRAVNNLTLGTKVNEFMLKDLIINRPGTIVIMDHNRPSNGQGNHFAIHDIETRPDLIVLRGYTNQTESDRGPILEWFVMNDEKVRLDMAGRCETVDTGHKAIQLIFHYEGINNRRPTVEEFRAVIEDRKTWEDF